MVLFFDKNVQGVQTSHNDAIVISMIIAKYDVKIKLVDDGSSADVLFYDIFQRMNILKEKNLIRIGSPGCI